MIDINELRRLTQAATHPITKGRWVRLFGERTIYDRLEDGCRGIPVVSTPVHPPHQFEAACLDFIAAANPSAISELLDRLEEAESDALEQARLNGMGASREAALMAKLEAAEKEVAHIKEVEFPRKMAAVAAGWENKCARLEQERDALRADLESWKGLAKQFGNEADALRAKIEAMEKQEPVAFVDYKLGNCCRWAEYLGWQKIKDGTKLYALPGAKGE